MTFTISPFRWRSYRSMVLTYTQDMPLCTLKVERVSITMILLVYNPNQVLHTQASLVQSRRLRYSVSKWESTMEPRRVGSVPSRNGTQTIWVVERTASAQPCDSPQDSPVDCEGHSCPDYCPFSEGLPIRERQVTLSLIDDTRNDALQDDDLSECFSNLVKMLAFVPGSRLDD